MFGLCHPVPIFVSYQLSARETTRLSSIYEWDLLVDVPLGVMNAARPKGLTETSVLMSITNAMGWAIIDWSKRNASHYFHRVHHAHFRGLCGYLVLLERSELGENTCPPNLNSFSVQREWLGPLPDNGTHYDFFGGDAGGFSSL